MTTKTMRRPPAIRRADAEEARVAEVKRLNESFYQNGTEWHSTQISSKARGNPKGRRSARATVTVRGGRKRT